MNRVHLKKISQSDISTFQRLFTDPQVMEFSEGMLSKTAVERWYRSVQTQYAEDTGFYTLAVELMQTSEIIGYCSLLYSPYNKEPEIGYRLLPEYWGRGLATEAVRLMLDHAFTVLGLDTVSAQIDPNNRRSKRLAQGLGMALIGQIKPEGYDYADEIWQLRRENYRAFTFKPND